MKAEYRTLCGETGTMEYGVITAQDMQKGDGYTLLGFSDWEAVHESQIMGAVTNVGRFKLIKDEEKGNPIGFQID